MDNKYDAEFYNKLTPKSSTSATKILKILYEVYQPDSVIDFGCGLGAWLESAKKLGSTYLHGIDGSWVDKEVLLNNEIHFTSANMENSVVLEKRYDLAISVEVAEHLSESRANSFVCDLCSASNLIVFSAATKYQGGTGHINEQPQTYWINLFKDNNYKVFDIFRGKIWHDKEIEWWYRQNIFLFMKSDVINNLVPVDVLHKLESSIFDAVHPEQLEKIINNPLLALKRKIKG